LHVPQTRLKTVVSEAEAYEAIDRAFRTIGEYWITWENMLEVSGLSSQQPHVGVIVRRLIKRGVIEERTRRKSPYPGYGDVAEYRLRGGKERAEEMSVRVAIRDALMASEWVPEIELRKLVPPPLDFKRVLSGLGRGVTKRWDPKRHGSTEYSLGGVTRADLEAATGKVFSSGGVRNNKRTSKRRSSKRSSKRSSNRRTSRRR
jgi:hypothetical protein